MYPIKKYKNKGNFFCSLLVPPKCHIVIAQTHWPKRCVTPLTVSVSLCNKRAPQTPPHANSSIFTFTVFTSGRVRSCKQQIQRRYRDVRLNMAAISRVVSLSRETRRVQDKKKKKEGHHLRWLQKKKLYWGADKSLARPGRKQATATEDFEFHISYLKS